MSTLSRGAQFASTGRTTSTRSARKRASVALQIHSAADVERRIYEKPRRW